MRVIDPAKPLGPQLDALLKCDGEGRNVLEARIAALVAILRVDVAPLLDNLQATQERCSTLLTELRAYRASGICLPGCWCPCGAFNGGEKERRSECRSCGRALASSSPPGPPP